ncbi:uncharacterized protein GVI51_L03861 [Nakaseomyces glabratus]|uniref:Mitochondrial import receptor subunit TOM70 n=1 Tax=Candida glabrata (strain ATCC 2001 / BCRC 20586 / JCM 3761 / NBRC 0622 / NRRL Y-65 / CBS 138) TaxID=284593 RepID=Q6FLE4_CANGA|nr:uncharacterized protein CAGL0L04048g [Nakaseomyces glabratus]KAH7595430.1 TPR repeat region circular profile [Nakaseomyces glabratus]KAH7601862.1 TPR repeat region circular profile [Nakaseomyces glabratus]QHS68619.1 uncharacterized protein GVI51_L03861 [Nakaseomyces glabratus]CAG61920.1 unnamed protein product [Nakaseomyces glabratus]|eukprot:XP_448950.1 uncharacterized protein CAGL0L04048g [[Candida] glabrata]
MSSDSNTVGFWVKNKKAVVASVATVSAVVAAYFYYKQVQELKKSLDDGNDVGTASSKVEYKYLMINDEPDIELMKLAETAEKNEYASELKKRGNAYFKVKDYENAINYYKFALQLKNDPVFYSNMAACYISLEHNKEAIEACSKALELNPDYSKVLLKRAAVYENIGKFADALLDLTAVSLNGDYNDATIQPIVERVLNKQAMMALKDHLEASEKNKVLPSYTSMAAFFGVFDAETDIPGHDATEESDKILSDALTHLYSQTKEGYDRCDSEFTKATELYKAKLENDRTNSVTNEKAAIAFEHTAILSFLKNDPLTARELVDEAIKLHPRPKSYIYLGLLMADKGLDEEYYSNFQKAIDLDPNMAAIYYHRGQMNFIIQKYEKAGEDFDKAKECDPTNIFPYIQLACMSYREGHFDDCETLFSEARRKFPDAPEVPNFFAEILSDKGEIEKAAAEYDKAIELESKSENIHVGIAPLVGKATTLLKYPTVENFIEADDLFEQANNEDPRSEKAKMGLAQCKLQQEDLDDAIRLFEEAAILCRTLDEKLQATTFAEATKVQMRVRADERLQAKTMKALDEIRRNGGQGF